MTATQMGRVQLRIMKVLWEREQASAREITDALNEQEPIAHSTVQTLLRKLEDKGAVGHRADGRTFVFFAQVQQERVVEKETKDLLERVFDGDASSLVSYLLKHEQVSRSELDEIRKLIDQRRKKRG